MKEKIGDYAKSIVYGGMDGIVTTFAVVAGAVGGNLGITPIVILGFSNLLADGLKRVPGIGWLGQAKLVVACLELRLLLQCLLYHFQSQMVIEQVGCRLFKGVHRRYHKPHLVQPRLLAQAFRQCDMAGMDGVEATAKDSYFFALNFEHRTLNFMISKRAIFAF